MTSRSSLQRRIGIMAVPGSPVEVADDELDLVDRAVSLTKASPNNVYLRVWVVLPWLRASRGMGEAAERSAAV